MRVCACTARMPRSIESQFSMEWIYWTAARCGTVRAAIVVRADGLIENDRPFPGFQDRTQFRAERIPEIEQQQRVGFGFIQTLDELGDAGVGVERFRFEPHFGAQGPGDFRTWAVNLASAFRVQIGAGPRKPFVLRPSVLILARQHHVGGRIEERRPENRGLSLRRGRNNFAARRSPRAGTGLRRQGSRDFRKDRRSCCSSKFIAEVF